PHSLLEIACAFLSLLVSLGKPSFSFCVYSLLYRFVRSLVSLEPDSICQRSRLTVTSAIDCHRFLPLRPRIPGLKSPKYDRLESSLNYRLSLVLVFCSQKNTYRITVIQVR